MGRSQRILLTTAIAAAGAIAGLRLRHSRTGRRSLAQAAQALNRQALQRLIVPAESHFVFVDDLKLHVIIAGPKDGPLAVLLHGFPECWLSWRNQIPVLARAGYRVVVPDQRGYNLSDKPTGVHSYRLDRLTADVRDLMRAFGRDQAVIVGHDWGGVVAWRFAMDYADAVNKLVVMNAPHPVAYAREIGQSWAQRFRSWYILFFQTPWLPETVLSLSPKATARLFFRRTALRSDAFSETDLEVMAAALAQPGAMRTMIHWYRAASRHPPAQRTQIIDTPTLLIWAEDDVALGLPLTFGLESWVPDLTLHYIPSCGHWVQNEAPDVVNAQLMAFLGSEDG